MMKILLVFIALLSGRAMAAVLDYCSSTYMRCCITEFLLIANADRGFDFSENKISETCMSVQDTFYCMDDFKEMCKNEALLNAVDVAHTVMSDLCSADSPLYTALKDQSCLSGSSEKVMKCVAEDSRPEREGLQASCCEYKRFKDCALHSVKANCSESVAVHANNFIVNVTGLGYEQVCTDYFPQCNFSVSLSSSFLLLIVSSLLHLVFR